MTPPPKTAAVEDTREDDSALMRRLQAGEEAALGLLMARWELRTKAVIGRLVLNATEADDLAQETFVRVWQQRLRFRPEAEFRPWLFAIAVNLARNRLRWWRRRPSVALDAWSESGAGSSSGAGVGAGGKEVDGALATSSPAGAAALERDERAAAVRDAIASLPSELREALVLFEYEELSQIEIAAVVGATPKAVETRIHRAREKLRARLRPLL